MFVLQVLALVFIRKLLDICFSKRELSYLDDLMPESKKKKLDDDSKKAEEVPTLCNKVILKLVSMNKRDIQVLFVVFI